MMPSRWSRAIAGSEPYAQPESTGFDPETQGGSYGPGHRISSGMGGLLRKQFEPPSATLQDRLYFIEIYIISYLSIH